MIERDFWAAEFNGTEKQVAYANDVRDYASSCIETVRECAIKCGNSEDDADAIKSAIIDGIEMDVANHDGISDGKISAGKFLDSVLDAFPTKNLMSGSRAYDTMFAEKLTAYANLGGYADLVIYNRGRAYLVAGHAKLEEARAAAK